MPNPLISFLFHLSIIAVMLLFYSIFWLSSLVSSLPPNSHNHYACLIASRLSLPKFGLLHSSHFSSRPVIISMLPQQWDEDKSELHTTTRSQSILSMVLKIEQGAKHQYTYPCRNAIFSHHQPQSKFSNRKALVLSQINIQNIAIRQKCLWTFQPHYNARRYNHGKWVYFKLQTTTVMLNS